MSGSRVLLGAAAALLLAASSAARADEYTFQFAGGGVSGDVTFAYGAATDARYSQALEITGASGRFSDASLGFSNLAVTGVVPVNHATPEAGNLLTPYDFSRYSVAHGLAHGALSFDDLLWPGGSAQVATTYPFHGGLLDIYGAMLTLSNGDVLNVWSNGVLPGTTMPDFGAAVATHWTALDEVSSGVVPTPEPATLWMLGTGLVGAVRLRRVVCGGRAVASES